MDSDVIYRLIRRKRWLSHGVIWTRYLIGFAFVPSGMSKLLGNRFTSLPASDPVGYFFDAMFRTGWYWNFLGLAQVAAALLLMTQRFATIGNMIFFPLILNIFLLTWSMAFQGTVFITGLLFMASTGLLLWDYPKWKSIFQKDNFTVSIHEEDLPSYDRHWIITGCILFAQAIALCVAGHFSNSALVAGTLLGMIAFTFLGSVILFAYQKGWRQ